jgi:urocanate hydratase
VPESRAQAADKPIRAPRGLALSCKGWQQEAALRLLMNSLDPAVAERPDELIVSGGIGKLARDWPAFHAIVKSLQALEGDETLCIRSGEPGPVWKMQPGFPRVLCVNSIVPDPPQGPPSAESQSPTPAQAPHFAADWMFTGPSCALPEAYETFRAAARKHFGGSLAGRLVVAGGMGGMGGAQPLAATLNGAAFLGIDADANRIKRRVKAGHCEVMVNNLDEALRILKNAVRKSAPTSVGLIANASELLPEFVRRGVLPDLLTDQTPADDLFAYIPQGLTIAQAAELRGKDPRVYRERALDSIATQMRAMLELKKMGAVVFEFGNRMRARALARGVADAYEIPDFASEYLAQDFAQGRGLLTLMALSGDPDDLACIDAVFSGLFPDSELQKWIALARKPPSPGLPARNCWIGWREAMQLGSAINDRVAQGEIKAPVAIGHSARRIRSDRPAGWQLPAEIANLPAEEAAKFRASMQHSADSEALTMLLEENSGAAWRSLESTVVLADGRRTTADTIERILGEALAASTLFVPRTKVPGKS